MTNPTEYTPNVGATALQKIVQDDFGRWSANLATVPPDLDLHTSPMGAEPAQHVTNVLCER